MGDGVTAFVIPLGISFALGLLIGFQRERTHALVAGARTFPLASVMGTLAAFLSQRHGGAVLAAALLAMVALIVLGNVVLLRNGHGDAGMTTEVALLATFLLGAFAAVGPPAVVAAVGGGIAVLLQLKEPLHGAARRLGDEDVKAIMTFVLVTLVVLPLLPDRTFGPYDVLNPRQLWWMVVLIVGISLAGYAGYRLLGAQAGAWMAGLLGGLISSTAVTVSYSKRAAGSTGATALACRVIVTASAVLFLRVLVEIIAVAPRHLGTLAPPLLLLGALLAVAAVVDWRRPPGGEAALPPQGNPTELPSALLFGALFAVVLVAVAWAKDQLGDRGLYAVAALSGLTDMDAITLSTAQLVRAERLPPPQGWRLIVVAALANLVFKGGVVGLWGGGELLRAVMRRWTPAALGGLLLLLLWPG